MTRLLIAGGVVDKPRSEVFQPGIALGLLSGDLLPAQEAKQAAAAAVKRL